MFANGSEFEAFQDRNDCYNCPRWDDCELIEGALFGTMVEAPEAWTPTRGMERFRCELRHK